MQQMQLTNASQLTYWSKYQNKFKFKESYKSTENAKK